MGRAAKNRETGVTPQQERFAQLVASGKSQADAYREAYPKSQKWAANAVHSKSSALAAIGKVRQRVSELRKPMVEDAQITLAGHLAALATLRDQAASATKFDAAVKAEELRGKTAGFYVERKEEGPPGAFNQDKEELRQRIKERSVRLGLAKVIPIEKGKPKAKQKAA